MAAAATGSGGDGSGRAGFSSTPFAIADFDGDQLPDLAVVQVESYSSPNNSYSIHVQFSSGPESAIRIEAPQGGLRISSRDVNGDDANDLIVTSTLKSHVVAVLVNDGHGNFAVMKPELFPNVGNEENFFLHDLKTQLGDEGSLLQSRSTSGEDFVAAAERCNRLCTGALSASAQSVALLRPVHPHLGRSPPVPVVLP